MYQLASTVIQALVEEDINVKFLVQLDKLIRLLETPTFAYLRLQVPNLSIICLQFKFVGDYLRILYWDAVMVKQTYNMNIECQLVIVRFKRGSEAQSFDTISKRL